MKYIITQDQFDSMYLNSGCPARKIMEELKPIDPLLAAAPDLLEYVQNKSSMYDAMLAGNAVLIDDLRKSLHEAKHCQCGYDDVCEFAREAEKLKAELAALQNQEPIAVYRFSVEAQEYGVRWLTNNELPDMTNLYLAAGAKEKPE